MISVVSSKRNVWPASQPAELTSLHPGPSADTSDRRGREIPNPLTGSDANSYLQRETSGLIQQDSKRKETRKPAVAQTLTFQH